MKPSRFLLSIIVIVGLFVSVVDAQPYISYLIPDIGANGTSTYVEIIAPISLRGAYGPDSVYANNPSDKVRVVCAIDADSTKVTFGPVVVSWQGRVISTHVFIGSCPVSSSTSWQNLDPQFKIPLKVVVNGVSSNIDTFYIVKPQPHLNAATNGIFGSGGIFGTRSRRGALLFDSINLIGNFTISTADCDPATPGNQGYLPCVILSNGPVSMGASTVLSADAVSKNGGPGGGGGSMGDGPTSDSGGYGYVGGSPGESDAGTCPATGGTGTGGYGNVNAGGVGLNGVPTEPSDVPKCIYFGGTGNPFVPTGGGVNDHNKHEGDGNGGGFGTAGEDAVGQRGSSAERGGIVNGNMMLIPMMGGSGGGGGNEFCTCDGTSPGAMGGGGGGALVLSASRINGTGFVLANGASGVSGGSGCVGHNSTGGSGSGGGIVLESKLTAVFPTLTTAGGASPHAHSGSGNGGNGRVRWDGFTAAGYNYGPAGTTLYHGLTTDTTKYRTGPITLTGTGNGSSIRIYEKVGSALWTLATTISGYSNGQWSWPVTIDPAKVTYLAAMQEVSSPATDTGLREPTWIMSQAAANIINLGPGGAVNPTMATAAFTPTVVCQNGKSWLQISTGCASYRIDSVRFLADTGGVFSVDSKEIVPRTVGSNGSDSIGIIFNSNHKVGIYGGRVKVFGKVQVGGGSVELDSVFTLLARSLPSTTGVYPLLGYYGFSIISSCQIGESYTLIAVGCTQYRIDSVQIIGDTGGVFSLDPKQHYPQTIDYFHTDSLRVNFLPNHRIGGFGAKLKVFGTVLSGSNIEFDTLIQLLAGSVASKANFQPLLSQIDWANLVECTSGDTTLTVVNKGCDTISVDSLHATGGSGFSLAPPALPTRLAPGASITLKVHFAPHALNSDSMVVRLFYGMPGFRDSMQLEVRGRATESAPVLTAYSPALRFGSVGSCKSADTVLVLKNSGCDSLTITSLSQLKNGFSLAPPPTLPITIAAGDSLVLHVHYKPVSGADNAGLIISDIHGAKKGSISVTISGQLSASGTAMASSYSTAQLSAVALCGRVDTTFLLSNPGCDTLVITDTSFINTLGINISGLKLPYVLPPDSSVRVGVSFVPDKPVDDSADLVYLSTVHGVGKGTEIWIHMKAVTGFAPLTLSAKTLAFDTLSICATDSAFADFTSGGCDSLFIDDLTVSGDADFTISKQLIGTAVGPNEKIPFRLVFNPQKKGQRTGTVTLTYHNRDGKSKDTTIAISAFVADGTRIVSQSASVFNFGTLSLCDAPDTLITVANNGCDTVRLTDYSLLNSGFQLAPPTKIPDTLAPGESRQFRVRVIMDTTGHPASRSGVLSLISNADNTLTPVPLSYQIRYPARLRFALMDGHAEPLNNYSYKLKAIGDLTTLGLTTVHFALLHNEDLLKYVTSTGPNTLQEINYTVLGGVATNLFELAGNPVVALADSSVATLYFTTALAKDSSTTLTLKDVILNKDDPTFVRCVAQVDTAIGSDYTALFVGCDVSTLQTFLNFGKTGIILESIYPNPATSRLTIGLQHLRDEADVVELRVMDLLGRETVHQFVSVAGTGERNIDVTTDGLASGVYSLQVICQNERVTRSFAKLR